ncbi:MULTISPECIES: hypothetical protein [Pseudomonas]|jgi:hypothetical protein|uniref:hypothetical protein n=1 Tax=Pseudomonas sp. IT-P171 TaxID=3026453 RepID=UPI0039E1DA47
MLDANATHISLTLEGVSVDLQVLSFVGREAGNQAFQPTPGNPHKPRQPSRMALKKAAKRKSILCR